MGDLSMKARIRQLLEQKIPALQRAQIMSADVAPRILIEHTKDKAQCDVANTLEHI